MRSCQLKRHQENDLKNYGFNKMNVSFEGHKYFKKMPFGEITIELNEWHNWFYIVKGVKSNEIIFKRDIWYEEINAGYLNRLHLEYDSFHTPIKVLNRVA